MAQTMASFHAGRRNNAWLPSAAVLGAACVACLHAPSAFVGQRPPLRVSNPPTVRFAGDNLFERFARVAKANVNKVLQGMEDPEKVLDQALDEMQGDLIKVRQSYAEVLATQRRLVNQKEQSDKLAEDWYRRAEMAVEKGDDELAKEALSRRQSSVQKATGLQDQIDAMTGNVEKLFESVKALEEKITQAKEEKEQLIARARTAKTTSQVNEMLSDVTSTGASGAFDRMKEKVEMLETRAEVSQGLLPEAQSSGSLEDRFKQLEAGSAVDDELAKLKGKKALPAGGAGSGSSSGASSDIDNELEAMRKKLKEDAN
ncbi:Probable membrane-associated 30 kDa protein [Durusdinium trenchii]|uniref:Chloroplastic n=1 Tax=Durusdinium trenchii TaxID=1381693 RepID=A0ABP0MUP2_9DINO